MKPSRKNRVPYRQLFVALVINGWVAPSLWAHGFVSEPGSRSALCADGINQACGQVVYEPQSVEGPDRYPGSGPADGRLASAGNAAFTPLDQQLNARWWKHWVTPGPIEWTWTFTAPHATRDFRYFITKPDWDPNQPLSRSQFEADPFCEVAFQNRKPDPVWTHQCELPARQGYQVVLAVWDVGDTVNSFYNAVDLYFGRSETDLPLMVDIPDGRDLPAGSQVQVRVFAGDQERFDLAYSFPIKSAADGQFNQWPRAIAMALNHMMPGFVRAGAATDDGIEPSDTGNGIYALDSTITDVKLLLEGDGPAEPLSVSGLEEHYELDELGDLSMALEFVARTNLSLDLSVHLGTDELHSEQINLARGTQRWRYQLKAAPTGLYVMTLKWVDDRGQAGSQTHSFEVWSSSGGDFDFRFPDGLGQYKPGTIVLGRDEVRYRCKPFPSSGWCNIYSSQSRQYEPGYGSHWRHAWERLP